MTTVPEIFEKMPESFQPEAAGMNAVILFDITGEGGGKWTAAIADDKLDVVQGEPEKPDLTIGVNAQHYIDISTGKLNEQLHRDPRSRYQSAREFRADVVAWLWQRRRVSIPALSSCSALEPPPSALDSAPHTDSLSGEMATNPEPRLGDTVGSELPHGVGSSSADRPRAFYRDSLGD